MQLTMLDRAEAVADGSVSLLLRAVEGQLAPWEPGAHIDLSLPNWLIRQYSLCGDPADRGHYRIAVRHDPLSRGGSEYVNRFLRPNHLLEVSEPRNNFPLLPAVEYLFIAGGIGITPIKPMFVSALDAGASATLVYVGRYREAMPFVDELNHGFPGLVRVVETVKDGRPDFDELASRLGRQSLVYSCGPTSMLGAISAAFPAERTHLERFQPSARTFLPNQPFEVLCARSGHTIQVGAQESMLDALNVAGLQVSYACREGVCGTCEVEVLDGEPEHRDDIGAQPGRLYCCVSRAVSPRLTVDL
jgi:ferredoxin-NADP reductase